MSSTTGGVLYFPAGSYVMSAALTVSKKNVAIVGDGWGATKITQTHDGNLFVFAATQGTFSRYHACDYTVERTGATTTGAVFVGGNNMSESVFERIRIYTGRGCFSLGTISTDYITAVTINDVIATYVDGGYFVDVTDGTSVGSITLSHCYGASGLTSTSSVGVRIRAQVDVFNIDRCFFTQVGNGLELTPTGTHFVSDFWVTNSIFGDCSNVALLIRPSSTAQVSRGTFKGNWFGALSASYTMLITAQNTATVFDLRFEGNQFLNGGSIGCRVENGTGSSREIYFDNCDFYDAPALNAELTFASGMTRFGVSNCRLNAKYAAIPGSEYGLWVDATCTDYVVANNDMSKHTTPFHLDATSMVSSALIKNNRGYNPPGLMTPPSVPATTVYLTNPFPFDCQVLVSGGTLTAVNVKGTNGSAWTAGTTAGTYRLARGAQIAITYTVAPTWTWFAE